MTSRSRSTALSLLVPLVLLVAAGCGPDDRDPEAGTTPSAPVSTTDSPSASRAPSSPTSAATTRSTPARPPSSEAPDGRISKLLVFVVENHSFDQMQAEMPFTRGLAERYGYASHYTAITHPSLPNYLAIAGGDTFGVADDEGPDVHPLPGHSVFGAAVDDGTSARLYADAMTSPCQLAPSGTYAVKHNPWAYFPADAQSCRRDDLPLAELGPDVAAGDLPAVGMVIPDLCNDAHDCSLGQADTWLATNVGVAMSGPDWASGRLAIVITADEDDRKHGNQILTVVANPSIDHLVVSEPLDHYALSRAYAEVAGVAPLGNAASAADLLGAFGLSPR